MTRAIALVLLAAFAVACSKDDGGGKKRDRDEDRDDDDLDRKKKKRDRDDDRDRDKDRDEDFEDEALRGLARYRDDMCDCKDAACGDDVKRDFKDWRKKMKAKMKDAGKPSERLMKRIMTIQAELDECSRKLKPDKDKPPTPPSTTP